MSQWVRLIGRSICSKKLVKDFWDVHFSYVVVESRNVNSNLDGFSRFPGNLFAVLIYYFEMGNVGFGVIVGYTVLVNCTGDVTAVFFDSIP